MLKNYFKVALRNLMRHKGFSAINIIGLAIGIACSILILLWVNDEISFDRFHSNYQNIFRVVEMQQQNGAPFPVAVTPAPLAAGLKQDFPEVISSTFLSNGYSGMIAYEDKELRPENIVLTNAGFFDVFDFEFISGDPETAFGDPMNFIITEDMAEKFFGDEDPMGKSITWEKEINLTISGVVKNPPVNSHIQFDFLGSIAILSAYGRDLENWSSNSFQTYIELHEEVSITDFDAKIADYLEEHDCGYPVKLYVQSLKDIYLKSDFTADYGGLGNILYVRIFGIIAVFILVIACVNFMNLSTARATKRSREVGLRKVVGAFRSNLIFQFLLESILLTLISMIAAVVIVEISLPYFNDYTQKNLSMNILSNFKLFLGLLSIFGITGILSGSYPALILSSFKPVSALKGVFQKGIKGALFRKIMVIFQFSLSIILIISTVIVIKQLTYMKTVNTGYDKENILYFSLNSEIGNKFEQFSDEIKKVTGVINMTTASQNPSSIVTSGYGLNWEGKAEDIRPLVHTLLVGNNFFETFDMEIIKGRGFSSKFSSDTLHIVLNEEALKIIGEDYPLEGKMSYYEDLSEGKMIGVVKNFHFKSLHRSIEPLAITFTDGSANKAFIKLAAGNILDTVAQIKKIVSDFAPESDVDFRFLDEYFNFEYRAELRMSGLFKAFTAFAIFISCLGLFGLASFMVEQRTKEIGVRKVLGSSVLGLITLLSKEFTKWVIISNIIAWPVSYYIMSKWLSNYAYKTELSLVIFVSSGLVALIIALLTVSIQTIKAANSNPIDALKYE
ncbi:ABC transporter permease [Candidatus Cloacimonadota bacterium]